MLMHEEELHKIRQDNHAMRQDANYQYLSQYRASHEPVS